MRVEGKGRINRDKPLNFTFDGKTYQGFEGDSLASALLANDVALVGRSFKYHRPRGIVTAGSDDPNGLVELSRGPYGAAIPNTRATMQSLYEGLVANSQNHLGPLGFDLLAVNDLAAPFLSAGFYYKTFMWPRRFWEAVYEPLIRRAAGLGRLSREMQAEPSEKAFGHCDLLVIGAGPSGLTAALVAAEAGADVILVDENTELGGRLWLEDAAIDDMPAQTWLAQISAKLSAMPNVRIMPRCTVTGAYDGGTYGMIERVGLEHAPSGTVPRECFWRITARAAILATGAVERPIAFANNDRPAIMMAGAMRSYLDRYGVLPARKIALFVSTDQGHRDALALQAAGATLAAVIDPRSDAPALGDYPLYRGAEVVATRGRTRISGITIRDAAGKTTDMDIGALGMSGGWNPNIHLACHMGARAIWNAEKSCFLAPEGAVPALHYAGSAAGYFSTAECFTSGFAAAINALSELGLTAPHTPCPIAPASRETARPHWVVSGKKRAWIDFANDVTTKDIRLAAQEGYQSVEHMKRYTTQGMAPDQGRSSNTTAIAVLADATGRGISETGTTTYRPPFVPVSLGAIGAGAQGKGFAPERLTTSHAASVARNAPMVATGLWYRASYFPQNGETTWLQSCNREVGYVRNAVGVVDVSTLGKIAVSGPDAARFLDFVYSNMMSTLPEGRVRYGLMLREDGFVMDDGTCARVGPYDYVITTTTAAAAEVMAHLEFVAQVFCPNWKLSLTSTTEAWAQFAVAGPKAFDLVAGLTTDLRRDELPFMGWVARDVLGVPARIFRISFSGEEGYEIAVPVGYGASLYDALLTRAEAMGGGPYGVEALNVLRLEKGFITHAEINGRVTAGDLSMTGLLSKKKSDFIGRAGAAREGLLDPARPALIGLRPVDGQSKILAGGHLFEADAKPSRETSKGYVSSACFSPTLGHPIALGFFVDGRARHGDQVKMVDHLRGQETLCEICPPVFFDPDGGRMRD